MGMTRKLFDQYRAQDTIFLPFLSSSLSQYLYFPPTLLELGNWFDLSNQRSISCRSHPLLCELSGCLYVDFHSYKLHILSLEVPCIISISPQSHCHHFRIYNQLGNHWFDQLSRPSIYYLKPTEATPSTSSIFPAIPIFKDGSTATHTSRNNWTLCLNELNAMRTVGSRKVPSVFPLATYS